MVLLPKVPLLILVFTLLCKPAFCQNGFVELQGKVYAYDGKILEDCNLQLKTKTGALIAGVSTGEANQYYLKVRWRAADTLMLTASHISYGQQTLYFYTGKPGSYSFDITLPPHIEELEDVTVKSAPITKRGDTTFYKAEAFKEPGQKKLTDLIQAMPGFTVTENGDLFYYNQRVEKLNIGGEDIFADNVQMLMKNLPIEKIKEIQAIENQNLNPKLKGLIGDDKVTVNIGLKDNTVTLGDAEVGGGTRNRYLVNPVFFGLYKKIKLGYIGNLNSYGQSLGLGEEQEIKGQSYYMMSRSMITPRPSTLGGFDASRYVTNHLVLNRLQLSFSPSKKIKAKTDFTFLKDHQQQRNSSISSFYSGSSYLTRYTNTNNHYKPNYLQLYEEIKWDVNEKSFFTGKLKFGKDAGNYLLNSSVTQNGIVYATNNAVKNNVPSLLFNSDYTVRFNKNNALEIISEFGIVNMRQNIAGTSANWKSIFGLPDSNYIYLIQPTINNAWFANISPTYIHKKGKRVYTYSLLAEYWNMNRNAQLGFQSAEQGVAALSLPQWSGQGNFTIGKLSTPFSYAFYILKQPIIFNSNIGLANIRVTEKTGDKNWTSPLIDAGLSYKKTIANLAQTNFQVKYNQSPQNIDDLNGTLLPSYVAQYSLNLTPRATLPKLYSNGSILFKFQDYSSLSISCNANFNLSGIINKYSYSGIASTSADSVAKGRSTYTLSPLVTYSFPFVPLGLKVSASLRYNSSSLLTIKNENIYTVKGNGQSFGLDLKRKWKKWLYLGYRASLSLSHQEYPVEIRATTNIRSLTSIQGFTVKAQPSKKTEILFSAEKIHFDNPAYPTKSFVFSDFEFIQTFGKKNVSLRLKVENIFDQKSYQTYGSSLLYETTTSIPLIQRNAFLALRVQL